MIVGSEQLSQCSVLSVFRASNAPAVQKRAGKPIYAGQRYRLVWSGPSAGHGLTRGCCAAGRGRPPPGGDLLLSGDLLCRPLPCSGCAGCCLCRRLWRRRLGCQLCRRLRRGLGAGHKLHCWLWRWLGASDHGRLWRGLCSRLWRRRCRRLCCRFCRGLCCWRRSGLDCGLRRWCQSRLQQATINIIVQRAMHSTQSDKAVRQPSGKDAATVSHWVCSPLQLALLWALVLEQVSVRAASAAHQGRQRSAPARAPQWPPVAAWVAGMAAALVAGTAEGTAEGRAAGSAAAGWEVAGWEVAGREGVGMAAAAGAAAREGAARAAVAEAGGWAAVREGVGMGVAGEAGGWAAAIWAAGWAEAGEAAGLQAAAMAAVPAAATQPQLGLQPPLLAATASPAPCCCCRRCCRCQQQQAATELCCLRAHTAPLAAAVALRSSGNCTCTSAAACKQLKPSFMLEHATGGFVCMRQGGRHVCGIATHAIATFVLLRTAAT